MNMDLNYLPQFKAVIEDIVKTQIKNMGITNYISAIVQKVNVDGTVDVYLPPNKFNIVTKLFNKTGEQINVGDSVEIATKNGSLSNAWIAVKHGNSMSDEHYKQTVSDSSLYLKYAGNHTESASGTTPSAPNYGMLYPSGFYLTGTYNDSNTPVSYGNIINMAGGGSSQLLCEWSGSDNGIGHLYYRNHRDSSTGGWSNWVTILDSNNVDTYALSKSGGEVNGTISSNGKLLTSKYTISLSSYSTSNFYPVTFTPGTEILDCEIHSPGRGGSEPYNQNVIHYRQMAAGWSDTPRTINILTYKNYDNGEITIGCIGCGQRQSYHHVVWLRGGLNYTIIANYEPTLHTSNYRPTSDDTSSIFTVGTNYYGGTNTYVDIMFTPQDTISSGGYINDSFKGAGSLTAGNGYLYSVCNGVTTQIGAQNSGLTHYSTTAGSGHWFNKTVLVQGSLYKGSSYNQNVPAVFVQSGTPTATQTGDIWFVT